MKKTLLGMMLALPMLFGIGMTSCSSEEPVADQGNSVEKLTNVTLTASLDKATRSQLNVDGDMIKFAWTVGDKVMVVNANTGKYVGTLKVTNLHKDVRVCDFGGNLNLPTDGNFDLKFFYMGNAGTMNKDENKAPINHNIDLSEQTGVGTGFADDDLLIAQRAYTNCTDGNLGMLDFDRYLAYGQFILKYNGEELDLNGKTVTIYANTGNLYKEATLDFVGASYTRKEGAIKVTPATNNFFVKFLPSTAVNLLFTVTMDNGEVFVGTKGSELVSSVYYSNEGAPIVIEMKHSDGRDDPFNYKVNFGNPDEDPIKSVEGEGKGTTATIEGTEAPADPTKEGYEFEGWKVEGADDNTATKEGPWTITKDPSKDVTEVNIVPVFTIGITEKYL